MDVDIQSPPYPGPGTTTELLHSNLEELRKWVLIYRDELNEATNDSIPDVQPLKAASLYALQPVHVLWSHLQFMVRVREAWDHLIRAYGDDWTSPECLRQRAMLTRGVVNMLNDAFTPFELREAREHREDRRMRRLFSRYQRNMMEELSRDDDDEDEDEKF